MSLTSPPTQLGAPALSSRHRWGVLLICSMSLLMVGLDVTIVNVALPSIGRDLHASVSGLQWTIDAYTLVLASLLMLSGATADRLGRKRIFLIGLTMFTLGSLLCSVAHSLDMLVVFRMLQAIGGSMLNPVAMSIITNTFTDPGERARAVGVWGAVVGISMALGPVIGGLLVNGVGWQSIFWINVPVGALAIALAWRFVPESRAATARRLDAVAQALVVVTLFSLTYAVIEAPSRGWGSALIVGLFVLGAASIAALIWWEGRRDEPLIHMRFFRSVPFSSAAVIAVAAFATLGGFLFLNTLYLQDVRGFSPLRAGLYTVPMAVMTMVCSPWSGRRVASHGARVPLVVAGVGITLGCALLTRVDATTPTWWLFSAYAVFGIGFGFVNAPITNTAVSGMPRAQAGVAAAIASTSRQVGATSGVAVVGTLLAEALHHRVPRLDPGADHGGWFVLVGCGLVIIALGLLATTPWAARSAQRTARELNPEALTVPS